MRFKISILLLSLSLLQAALAAQITIEGQVRHANTYQEIAGVNIYIENSTLGTVTDIRGAFNLTVEGVVPESVLIFEHVSFDTLRLTLAATEGKHTFYLTPRIIPVNEITIESSRNLPEIIRDLPQPYSVIGAEEFEAQGYIDAGDLLRTEQSIQIDEELSGKKTIALRAGNPDDVIVLYNGIKMNSLYDNIFDLSLINIDDVQHFEIIRGSHTSLYGPEAFSGVINVVPKMNKKYLARFQQKIGTYAAGDWSLQLNRNLGKRLNVAYSYKTGASKRRYLARQSDEPDSTSQVLLNNKLVNHMATAVLDLSDDSQDRDRKLSLMYLNSRLDYNNSHYDEKLKNVNQLISLRYTGNISFIQRLTLAAGYQWLDRRQVSVTEVGNYIQHFDNHNFHFNIDKDFRYKNLGLLLTYQYDRRILDLLDDRNNPYEQLVGVKSADFSRFHHGFASIVKFTLPTRSHFLKLANVDFSYRYDNVTNDQDNTIHRGYSPDNESLLDEGQLDKNNWSESTVKFSTQLLGSHRYFGLNSYLNFGSNVKFPTMFQQISSPRSSRPGSGLPRPSLKPEGNQSLEIGLDLSKEINEVSNFNGWRWSLNYFQNYYTNKFLMYYTPGIPIAFFDNVQNASIFGAESKIRVFLLKSKLSLELGASKYSISDKAAFPFKSDSKIVFNLYINHAGYSFRLHSFRESEQTGWVRDRLGYFYNISLPGYSNMDIHLSKTFELRVIKLFLNLSARNLLDNDTILEGIALRDRRYYISFGVEY